MVSVTLSLRVTGVARGLGGGLGFRLGRRARAFRRGHRDENRQREAKQQRNGLDLSLHEGLPSLRSRLGGSIPETCRVVEYLTVPQSRISAACGSALASGAHRAPTIRRRRRWGGLGRRRRHDRRACVHGGEPALVRPVGRVAVSPSAAHEPACGQNRAVEPRLKTLVADGEVREHVAVVQVELRDQAVAKTRPCSPVE